MNVQSISKWNMEFFSQMTIFRLKLKLINSTAPIVFKSGKDFFKFNTIKKFLLKSSRLQLIGMEKKMEG